MGVSRRGNGRMVPARRPTRLDVERDPRHRVAHRADGLAVDAFFDSVEAMDRDRLRTSALAASSLLALACTEPDTAGTGQADTSSRRR